MSTVSQDPFRHALGRAVQEYHRIHTLLGIVGNVLFFVGAILFLFEPLETAGVWLFIIGAFGMLVGSIGSALVQEVEAEDGLLPEDGDG